MSSNNVELRANRLLAALPPGDRCRVLENCQAIELSAADMVYRAGEIITHGYFPTESCISLVKPLADRASLEVGLTGSEGMLGITLLLEVYAAPFDAVVQGPGTALRIPAAALLLELHRSPTLLRALNRYLYVSMRQLAQTAACTRFHVVEARLARWLLMTQDRAHADTFHVTHEFLAYMLGVRRVGITKAARWLQQQDLISYHRGDVTVLDRSGLEAASCRCYRDDVEIYRRIMGDSSLAPSQRTDVASTEERAAMGTGA